MSENKLYMHYVSTLDEAAKLINAREDFWVSNCGCRERGEGCKQSRTDVCLMFSFSGGASGSNAHPISKCEAMAILQEAISKKLVARPFRNDDFTETDGICFCCQDCCGYFLDPAETCNKGKYIEQTDIPQCINCGLCVDVCYFQARKITNTVMEINRDKCYGCGLCVDVCPTACIKMVQR
jgi:Pyruvate/2-oxoacid:ferredoxin oxidoreductase delta subunit